MRGGGLRHGIPGALLVLLLAGSRPAAAQDSAAAELSGLDIDELARIKITSVSRKPESIAEATAAVSVISREDIRRSGALSVPEALRLVPGLTIARIDSRDWAISARGFNDLYSNKLLVMVDGRTIYSPAFAGVFWDVQEILLDNVDRIEVIRGPGATLWGANAVNGVINIITRPASESSGGRVSVLAGTGPQLRGIMRYGATLGAGSAVRVYATGTRRSIAGLAGGAESHDDWRMGQGGFRADWTRGERDRFTLAGDAYVARGEQRFTVPMLEAPFTELVDDDLDANGAHLTAEWRRTLTPRSDFAVQAYFDRSVRHQPRLYGDMAVNVFDVDFQHRFPLGTRNEVLWGLGARRTSDRVGNAFLLTFEPAERATALFTGFVQDEIVLLPERVALTLGSKFEHNDFTGLEIQPNLRALWTPNLSSTVWAAVSRAVRTPSRLEHDLAENALVFDAPPVTVVRLLGNEAFVSEHVVAYELGYRTVPHSRVSLDVAVFYNRYDRLRSFAPGPPETGSVPVIVPFLLGNDGRGRTLGAEMAASLRAAGWWRLRGHYTWLDMEVELRDAAAPGALLDANPGLSAEHRASLWSSFNLPGGVELDLGGRYVSALEGTGPAVPDYVTADARLAFRLGSLGITLLGKDLLAAQHGEFPLQPFGAERREIRRRGAVRVSTEF